MASKIIQGITNFKVPNEWFYRGEGNCNVVLSIPKHKKILRIRKTNRPRSLLEWLIVWISDILYWYCGKSIKDELRDLNFYSVVMRPLIGRRYTSEVKQVVLSRKEVKILENELSNCRSEFRKTKILQCGRAALFEDFAFLSEDEYDYLPFEVADNTFAVEIKPKQGWRPLSEKHFPKCLFCMNQYLKMENKKIKHFSKYCPEELFSGNPDRMRSAIKSLIEVPQNNFRIFKNGILCYGEKVDMRFHEIIRDFFEADEETDRLQEEFCALIQNCLLTNLYNTNPKGVCQEKLFCEWNEIIEESNVDTILPKGCVLKQILSVQMLDTEGSNYYNKLYKTKDFKDWDYVNKLLNELDNRNTCLKCAIMILSNTNKDERDFNLNFVPYMISSIAKDCSLMITFKKLKENISDNLEMKNIIKTSFGCYLINIGVFDLYPKPLSTIKKHYKRNGDIFQAYINATEKIATIKKDHLKKRD